MQQAEYDVLQLVKQVGGLVVKDYVELTYKELETFAKLVDAKAMEREREECAKLCDIAPSNTLPARLAMQIRARGNKE